MSSGNKAVFERGELSFFLYNKGFCEIKESGKGVRLVRLGLRCDLLGDVE